MAGPAEIVHGPALIGDLINVLLFGIMIAQTYIYYTTYKDRTWMKLLIAVVFVADTVNTVFNILFIYGVLITRFGDYDNLARANIFSVSDPVTTGFIGLLVQLFFAWRIHVLTKNWILVSVVVALALVGAVGAFITAHEVLAIPEFARFQEFQRFVIMWLASAAAADIIITTILVWYLVRFPRYRVTQDTPNASNEQRKHKTGFRGSDMMVDRIIRVTMQTGLVTSVVAIIDLIVFLTDPTGLHLLFNIPLCKLYSNSLVSNLNSRRGWKYDESQGTSVGTFVAKSQPSQIQFGTRTMQSGWGENTTSTPRGTVGKVVELFDSKRPTANAKSSEVYVQVESHEMRDTSKDIGAPVPPRSKGDTFLD